MDRDNRFCSAFCDFLKNEGTEPVRLPPRSANLSAHIERFIRSIKSERLSQLIFFGEKSLRNAVREFLAHYHRERNHQGLSNHIIEPGEELGQTRGDVRCSERLGGLLRYYDRDAA